jgi:hypothetical protein
MKKSIFLPFLMLLITVSCNNSDGSGGAAAVAGSNSKAVPVNTTPSASDPSQGGYGTFTFTQDGKQRTFTAWHVFVLFPRKTSSGSSEILMLEDGGPANAGFDFKINKEGTTEFKTGYANNLMPNLFVDFFDTTGISYTGDGMVVNVASLTANKLTGTFSGRFVKEKSQIKENSASNVPQEIEVTDGKFDLHQ